MGNDSDLPDKTKQLSLPEIISQLQSLHLDGTLLKKEVEQSDPRLLLNQIGASLSTDPDNRTKLLKGKVDGWEGEISVILFGNPTVPRHLVSQFIDSPVIIVPDTADQYQYLGVSPVDAFTMKLDRLNVVIDALSGIRNYDSRPAETDTPIPASQSMVTVTWTLNRKVLTLYRGKNISDTIFRKRFQSTKNDNYKACHALLESAGQPLNRSELGIKGKSVLKDVTKSMGFTGTMLDLFITPDTETQTLTLTKSATISVEDVDEIKKMSISKTEGIE